MSHPSPYAVQPAPARDERPISVMAIVAFILGFVVAVAGAVLGIVALVQIRRSHLRGGGLAVAAIAVGAGFTVLEIGVLILGQQVLAEDAATKTDLMHARVAMINYAGHNNGIYPADIIGLEGVGFNPTAATSHARIVWGATRKSFCIQSTSQAGHVFRVTQSGPPVSGSCP